MFAIKVVDDTGIVIGHLPREISRPTKFLIDRGAVVTAKVSSREDWKFRVLSPFYFQKL